MSNLVFREWLNGALIPLNLFIMAILVHTLWRTRVEHGRGWYHQPGVSSVCAFFWIFCADLIRSVLAWSILHSQSMGTAPNFNPARTTFYVVAAVVATVATFRLIYISWGHRGWISAAAFTLSFVLFIQFVPSSEIEFFGMKVIVP